MIDLAAETLLTISQAARIRPPARGGRPTHSSTIYRWITRGIRGCKLEAIRLGGTLYTSREAMQRFADRLTGLPAQPGTGPTEADRRRLADATEEELTSLGL